MRKIVTIVLSMIIGAVIATAIPALAGPPQSGFVQQVPNIGKILNENGKAVQSVHWTDLDAACSSGGTIKIRRTAELGAQSVQVIDIAVTCGNHIYDQRLDGFIEGVDIVIPPR